MSGLRSKEVEECAMRCHVHEKATSIGGEGGCLMQRRRSVLLPSCLLSALCVYIRRVRSLPSSWLDIRMRRR